MKKLHFDFETYSEVDLTKSGAWVYAEHPSTEPLCMAWAYGNDDPKLWVPGMPIPEAIMDQIKDTEFWAWNAQFEWCIWSRIMSPRFGWPMMEIDQMHDAMAVAAYFNMPQKLKTCALVLEAELKNEAGTSLITKLCKPCKPTKKFPLARRTPGNSPELFQELYDYCLQDVVAERSVLNMLPQQRLRPEEQRRFTWNLKANERGIKIDKRLVANCIALRDEHIDRAGEKFMKITDGIAPKAAVALKQWCTDNGYEIDNMQADTVRDALEQDNVPDRVRSMLEAKTGLSMASASKYDAMVRMTCADGRYRGALQYYGASTTGRFAGRGVQLQNLARGHFKDIPLAIRMAHAGNLDDIQLLFGDPMQFLSTLLRPCLTTARKFVVADYSSIEARGVSWLCDHITMLNLFHSGEDVYKWMATIIFDIDISEVGDDERFVGKQAILGLGYQMGVDRFIDQCASYGVEIERKLAIKTIDAYREENAPIAQLWDDYQEAMTQSILERRPVECGKVTFFTKGRWAMIKLPSGRCLSYYLPRVVTKTKTFHRRADGEPFKREVKVIEYFGLNTAKQPCWVEMYGGKIVENVNQAICRDIMVHGIENTHELGYDFVLSVHDESISEHDTGDLGAYESALEGMPEWAKGGAMPFPVKAEGWVGKRYRK